MGDTGSQFLGVFLAYIGIQCFWNVPAASGEHEAWRAVTAAVVVFALPIIDTTTVTINRLLAGGSPFVGGKDHTTHHLSYAGLSDPQVALAMAGFGALSALLYYIMATYVKVWSCLHTVLFGAYVLVVFILLFGLTKWARIDRSLPPDA